MTSATGLEIQVTAESAAAAVTRRARVISRRKVFLGASRANLPLLGQATRCVVTIIAVQTLSCRVISVTKGIVVRDRGRRRARISLRLMTHAARREVTTVRLRVRRVTGVAAVVRRDSGGNR